MTSIALRSKVRDCLSRFWLDGALSGFDGGTRVRVLDGVGALHRCQT